jgi:hypothetical protein
MPRSRQTSLCSGNNARTGPLAGEVGTRGRLASPERRRRLIDSDHTIAIATFSHIDMLVTYYSVQRGRSAAEPDLACLAVEVPDGTLIEPQLTPLDAMPGRVGLEADRQGRPPGKGRPFAVLIVRPPSPR